MDFRDLLTPIHNGGPVSTRPREEATGIRSQQGRAFGSSSGPLGHRPDLWVIVRTFGSSSGPLGHRPDLWVIVRTFGSSSGH